ncbi:MAG: hypothetical protein NZ959_12250 [Armatimonadetes bacterium]|nr:hypothetical protein [Armatimonadota bacterium]MDW8123049.1 DUF6785 family protein [Armatimonadota bacterium]
MRAAEPGLPDRRQQIASVAVPLEEAVKSPVAPIPWKGLLLGFALVPLNLYWILQLEIVQFVSWPTILSLPMNALAFLVVLSLANGVMERRFPLLSLSQRDLLLTYLILCLSSAIGGTDFLQVLISMMGYPHFFATPENRFKELFLNYLPDWLIVSDVPALRGFYYGESTIYRADNLVPWLIPIGSWFAFTSILIFSLLCLSVLVRQRWSEEERLSYPLIWCPIHLSQERLRFWRNSMVWWGVASASYVSLLSGIRTLFPTFPGLVTRGQVNWGELIPKRPWNAFGIMPVGLYPFVIGLGAFMPLDLSFSCWFFAIFQRLERVAIAVLGWDVEPRVPYFPEQATSVWTALCLFLLWNAKSSLSASLRRSREDDSSEVMPVSVALISVLIGFVLLVAFGFLIGQPVLISLTYFTLYFLLSLAFTRSRAELGAIAHDLPYGGPTNVLTTLIGSRNFHPRALTAVALYYWFNRSYGSHPMPFFLEGFRMARQVGINLKTIAVAGYGACLFSFLIFFWITLHIAYRLGAATARIKGDIIRAYAEIYPQLQSWLIAPTPPRRDALAWMTGAFLSTWLLMSLRFWAGGLPIHPMGYALASNWSMDRLWSSLLVSWLAKLTLLHLGGMRAYNRALPFFEGLVVGDTVMATFWGLTGVLLKRQTFSFWP